MSLQHLPDPIRDAVRVDLDQAAVDRGWDRLDAPRRTIPWGRLGLASSGVALAATAALLLWPAAARPLRAADGARLAASHRAGEGGARIELDDGSRLELSPHAVVEVLENADGRVMFLLERGRARFVVEPGTGREWTVEAGLASVRVTGTVFTVMREEREVGVAVERGRVLVRSGHLPHGVRALGGGESVTVEAPPTASRSPSAERAEAARRPPRVAVRADRGEAESGRADPGDPRSADEARAAPSPVERRPIPARGTGTPPRTMETPAASAEVEAAERTAAEWLAEADRARAAGDTVRGLDLLARAADRDAASAAVALSARARWLLDLGRAAEASRDLERARTAAAPPALREMILALRVQAYARQGRRAEAESAGHEYDAAYGEEGHFARSNARWLDRVAP